MIIIKTIILSTVTENLKIFPNQCASTVQVLCDKNHKIHYFSIITGEILINISIF